MKWIGQHIWSFISRFRSDVYLENVTESAQDHVVGIDAAGKLYKQDVSTGDITGVTITTDSGGGSAASDTGGSADFSILGSSGVGVTNSGTTITAVAVPAEIDHNSLSNWVAAQHYDWASDNSSTATIHTNNITDLHGAGVDGSANQLLTDDGDGTVTSESSATYNDGFLALTSATTGQAALQLTTTADGNKPTNLVFIKNRSSTTATTGDFIGMTSWYSDNAGGTPKAYAEHYVQATGVTSGDEYATHILTCATSTGSGSSRQNMITGLGSASANTINTTIGYGTASTCTIAGDVVLEGDNIRVSGSSTQSARIGLSEDTDNGTDIVVLAAPAATSGQTITLPDATGTVALVDSTARQIVSLRTDDAYIMYLGSVNRWYQANRAFSSIGVYSTLDGQAVVDSTAMTAASYIAIRPCTIHSVVIAWYQSATADVEFEILKVPLVDNSTSNVTFAKMTHTDHNASYTSNTNYIKTFAITGGNTLTAGQGLALTARRTSGSAAYMNGGQVYAEIEITG
jgi:hypothetical protein